MQSSRGLRISILAITAALISIGIIMIYSSSAVYTYERFGDNLFFLKRHLVSLAAALGAGFIFMRIDLDALRGASKALLAISLALLALVLIPGAGLSMGGARRWLRAGALHFQPVEIIKPFFLVYIADFLDRKSLKGNSLYAVYLPLLAVICAVCGLILLEPDTGSSIELAVIGLLMLFAYGARLKHLFFTFLAGMPLAYFVIAGSQYRLMRITAFINPWSDPKGAGFQMIQSFIALGSGGLFGAGLGGSRQKLFYLPESHTDFIFSIIGEELGFLGAGLVVLLFAALLWQGMNVAMRKGSEFSRLLAFGISSMIAIEAVINIGVATGLLPTKGLPLPFVSYGGSSLLSHIVLIAMLLNLGRENVR